MKVSNIGLISKKLEKLDEQFPVQDMLVQTGQLYQYTSGIYAFGHIPFLLEKKINQIICETLTKHGCSELSLPLLQPEQIWEESGRLKRYVEDGVMFRSLTKNGNYCLAPTAEEAIVAFARTRLKTYKQLPATYFQIGPKFRNELRARGFLLRGKSFDMMDAYSFGRNKDELETEYQNIKKAYFEIFEKLCIPVIPVGADSGAIGGAKSEEFMTISEIGEDIVYYDENTKKAFNSELLEKNDWQQYLSENYGITNFEKLSQKRTVELGHIFQLGEKYSSAMNGLFVDDDGSQKPYVMGCYGIGVSRTLALIYENSIVKKDGKFDGIALPVELSPYTFYFVTKNDDAEKTELANQIYENLQTKNVEILFDDRKDVSIGMKIKDSKICGTPFTVVFGRSLDDGYLEVENNKTGEKQTVKLEEFEKFCFEVADKKY